MKKIVVLTDQLSQIGGINSLIYLKTGYWVNVKSYQVTIITTEQKGLPLFYPIDKKVKIQDLSINYNRNSSYFSPKNLYKVFKNLFKLQKSLNEFKPDFIIIANHIPVTFFFPLLITKAKFIKEFHFSKFHISKQKQTFFKRLEHRIESKLDGLVVLSPEESTFYNHKNIIIIPNPIYINQNEIPIFSGRKKIAMCAGRISEVKRFDKAIDIWADFIESKKDWILEIYGDGEKEYVQYLKEKINALGLTNHVYIKGSINTIQQKMRENGLYLMTSSAECFPMVLLEAKSCGLPIISFDCPTGPRNIINNNHDGILIENNNNIQFVQKLIELSNNELLRNKLAFNAYKNVLEFNVDSIMLKWETQILNKA